MEPLDPPTLTRARLLPPLPVQVANLALLGPDYSDWRLHNRRSSSPPPQAPAPTATAAAPALQADPELLAEAPTPAGRARSPTPVPASQWGLSATSATPSRSPSPSPTASSAGGAAPLPPALRTLRDAAHLAQSNYVASNPTARVSPAAELAVAAVDSLAGEMLFRGLLLTCLAHWTRDRLMDAGVPDAVPLPAAWFGALAHGAVVPSTTASAGEALQQQAWVLAPVGDVALWASGGLVLALLLLLSSRRARRHVRKTAMLVDIRERIDASRKAQQEQLRRKRQLQGGGGAGAGAPQASAAAAAAPTTSTTPPVASASEAAPPTAAATSDGAAGAPPASSPSPAPSTSSAGSDAAPSSSSSSPSPSSWPPPPKGMAGSSLPPRPGTARRTRPPPPAAPDGSSSKPSLHGLLALVGGGLGAPAGWPAGGGGGSGGKGGGYDALVWATALQCSRDLLQGGTLTLAFVATGGNLAACFAASLANQVVFSALQRAGAERTRQVGAPFLHPCGDPGGR